jgi:hypothetical protein
MSSQQDARLSNEASKGSRLRIVGHDSPNPRPFENDDGLLSFVAHERFETVARSLDDFCQQLLEHAQRIAGARSRLDKVFRLFSYQSPISSQECDQAIADLQPLRASIFQFCGLVERATSLPLEIIPLRYPLVVILYYVNEQISQLTLQITSFRQFCHQTPKQTVRCQQEIQRKCETILRSSDEIKHLVESLVDRAHTESYEAAMIR